MIYGSRSGLSDCLGGVLTLGGFGLDKVLRATLKPKLNNLASGAR